MSRKKQKGQGLTEYLILVALIAVSSISIVRLLGHTTTAQLARITRSLQGHTARKIKIDSVSDGQYSQKDLSDFMRNAAKGER